MENELEVNRGQSLKNFINTIYKFIALMKFILTGHHPEQHSSTVLELTTCRYCVLCYTEFLL